MNTIVKVSLMPLVISMLALPGPTAAQSGKAPPKAEKKEPDTSVLADPSSVNRVAIDTCVLSSGIRDLAARETGLQAVPTGPVSDPGGLTKFRDLRTLEPDPYPRMKKHDEDPSSGCSGNTGCRIPGLSHTGRKDREAGT